MSSFQRVFHICRAVLTIVTDDQRNLETFRALDNTNAVTWRPAFNRSPRQDLTILLNNVTLVIDQDQSIVRVLLGVFFVPLSCSGRIPKS